MAEAADVSQLNARRRLTESNDPEHQAGERAEPYDVLWADAALGTYRRFLPGMGPQSWSAGSHGDPGR
jgi:hypothetical protein